MRRGHDRRRDTDDRRIDSLGRRTIGDVNGPAEERAQALGDARLEEVRAPGRQGGDGIGILVVPVHGDALARERHRQGDSDVSQTDDENAAHPRSPSATSRIAFSRPAAETTSSATA